MFLRMVKQTSLGFLEANVAGSAAESLLLILAWFYNVWIYR